MGFKVDDESLKKFFKKKEKKKTPEEERNELGLGKATDLTIKFRVVEWIKKVWDHLDPVTPRVISDHRLKSEIGVQEITSHARNVMRERNVCLRQQKRWVGNKRRIYWLVTKCE